MRAFVPDGYGAMIAGIYWLRFRVQPKERQGEGRMGGHPSAQP